LNDTILSTQLYQDNCIILASTIFLTLRTRGGMYHFTSGRNNLQILPCEGAKLIKQILAL